MVDIKSEVYNLNKESAEKIANIPYVGKPYLDAARVLCDYAVNPLTVGGDHVGCMAIQDVYSERFGSTSDKSTVER